MPKARVGESTYIASRTAVPIAAAVCLFCLTATAAEISVSGYTFETPPIEFIREPEAVKISRVPAEVIRVMCGAQRGRHVLGCTLKAKGMVPVIFIREGLGAVLDAMVLLHEIAHVNGWEHG
jgi:hypothetical protein